MKKMIGEVLKKIAGGIVSSAPASWCGCGVEEMPESMKKSR